MRIVAITSQKGGVGKTTTTVNLGAALAEAGRRVLLADLDPQGSLTAAVGSQGGRITMGDILRDPDAILNGVQRCAGGMQAIPAAATLATVLQSLNGVPAAAFRLKRALLEMRDCYDYALIDCPPALSQATTNALTAAHLALVPLQCEFLSLRGLTDVQEIAGAIRETTNPGLQMRVLATMFDKRTLHTQEVLRSARSALPGLVFEAVIPRTIRLAEAPALGMTILEYAPDSNGAFAYRMLAQELLQEEGENAASGRHPGRHSELAGFRRAG